MVALLRLNSFTSSSARAQRCRPLLDHVEDQQVPADENGGVTRCRPRLQKGAAKGLPSFSALPATLIHERGWVERADQPLDRPLPGSHQPSTG
jgi:hypothetical protein